MRMYVKFCFIVAALLFSRNVYADATVNVVLKNNGIDIVSMNVLLPDDGVSLVNDSDLNPHEVNARSVLNIISIADANAAQFSISTLQYYSSFNAFYLKCINADGSNLCDNWQYDINDSDPGVSMDQAILSGGENVVLFFGDKNPEPVPEVTPIEPEPPVVKHRGSSGGSGSRLSSVEDILEVPTEIVGIPVTVPVAPPTVVTMVAEKTIAPVIEKTPAVVQKNIFRKSTLLDTAVTSSQAAVVTADATTKNSTAEPAHKENWFKFLFKWLVDIF